MTNQSNTNNSSDNQIQASTKPSALSKFHISFEYDRSWNQAKQTVLHRPIKK